MLAPLNVVGDREGVKHDPATNTVTTPAGFKEAYETYAAGGWQGLSVPEQYGGQGLPMSLGMIKAEMIGTANWAWSMYPGLSIGAMNTLILHGSEEQKQKYLTKLASGQWGGTMCLTEPHCGTDLSQVKTKAEPIGDGRYKLNGTKIWISAGDHDMTENIIHIVLARLPGAPEGTKGISLFLVPKYLEKADGSLDTSKKNINCTALEKKMGIHGSATCVMTFDNSVGWLIGQPNTGLHQMFTFMNTARLGTAIQGLATCELAYQNALPFAKERLAMRSLTGAKFPDKPADPIIVHPDVRRMLMTQKCLAEGARSMCYDVALMADAMLSAKTMEEQKRLDSELGLFTPIVKGFLTEMGLEAAKDGMQVWGGAGFTKDPGMEQIYRDARISTIYEGTTGVQALDLLGRKVLLNRGKHLWKFTSQITKYAFECGVSSPNASKLRGMAYETAKRAQQWNYLTARLLVSAASNKEVVGSASYDYLMFGGYTSMAYHWLRMANVALTKLKDAKTDSEKDFYKTKFQTAQFFFDRILPRVKTHATTALASPKTVMQVKTENF